MATRNPLNQRYQGEGPGGQTRKSASSVKPAKKAASSVNIKKKPTTASEKKAAAKAREREAAQKAKEKAAKQAERAKAQSIEAEKLKAANAGSEETKSDVPVDKPRGFFSFLKNPGNDPIKTTATPRAPSASPAFNKTEEYLKWRRIYWILLGVGVLALIGSIMISSNLEYGEYSSLTFLFMTGIAYAAIIASLFINLRKMRPIEKRNTATSTAKKSPKALKHEQEAREQAAQVEAARKAAKARKKSKQEREIVLAPGEEDEMEK